MVTVATTIAEAETLGAALDENFQQAWAEIAEAVTFLKSRTAVDVHQLSRWLATRWEHFTRSTSSVNDPANIHAAVVFYGTGVDDCQRFERRSYLGHFAADDPYEPPANVDQLEAALRSAGRPATLYTYEGTGHWFFEPDRTDAYDEATATLAWERTLAFLKQSAAT